MSNLSLKEQLEALSLGSTPLGSENGKRLMEKSKSHKLNKSSQLKTTSPVKSKPAWLELAQYGVELLKAHFPLCFKDMNEIQPLKVGIKQDLVKSLGAKENITIPDKACMVSSLTYYVNSPSYHKSVVEGTARIDLEGHESGMVTADEARYSLECRENKLRKKKNNTK